MASKKLRKELRLQVNGIANLMERQSKLEEELSATVGAAVASLQCGSLTGASPSDARRS